jgi:NAD-dependent dihydropyrimidine dehydrogenase PreA subunit
MAGNFIYRLLAIRYNLSHMPVPITPGLIELMKEFYSPEEARLITFMPLLPSSAKKIAQWQFKNIDDTEKILKDLAVRGLLVGFVKKGVLKYQMAPFVPGIVEMQLMKGEDTPASRRTAQKIHDGLLEMNVQFLDAMNGMGTSFARVIPVNEGISSTSKILPYEDARAIINKSKKFAISHCYCRTDKHLRNEKACGAPREICMSLDFAADFLIRNNIAKETDRETMLEKLDLAEKHNLVHMTDNAKDGFTFICNCCGCCCGLLGASTRLNSKPATVSSSYIVEWDMEKCNHCGKCARACQINALQWINKITVYNEKRCIGCGECISSCPKDALKLVPRKDWKEPQETFGGMVADMMARRIKSGMMLPIKKMPGHKFIAKIIDDINRVE